MQALPRKPRDRAKRVSASSPSPSRTSVHTRSIGARTRAAAESDTAFERANRISSPSVALLETELDAEVDRPHDESLHPRLRRDLVRLTQAVGRLDDRNDRRPVFAERVDGLRRRLRQHQHVRPQLVHERDVRGEERGVARRSPGSRRARRSARRRARDARPRAPRPSDRRTRRPRGRPRRRPHWCPEPCATCGRRWPGRTAMSGRTRASGIEVDRIANVRHKHKLGSDEGGGGL